MRWILFLFLIFSQISFAQSEKWQFATRSMVLGVEMIYKPTFELLPSPLYYDIQKTTFQLALGYGLKCQAGVEIFQYRAKSLRADVDGTWRSFIRDLEEYGKWKISHGEPEGDWVPHVLKGKATSVFMIVQWMPKGWVISTCNA